MDIKAIEIDWGSKYEEEFGDLIGQLKTRLIAKPY